MGTMGIWGSGYRDSEDYLDELPAVASPLVEQVAVLLAKAGEASADSLSYDALRRRLMTVWEMLASVDDVRIYERQAAVLRDAAQHVRAQALSNSADWPDAEEFVVNATYEAARVEQWLDELTPAVFPGLLKR